jgi:hypothetical protein
MTEGKGRFRKVLEAMIEGRRQRAERRMREYLEALGLDAPKRD